MQVVHCATLGTGPGKPPKGHVLIDARDSGMARPRRPGLKFILEPAPSRPHETHMPFPFTFKLSSQLSVNNPFVAGQQDAQFFQGARSPSRARRGFGSDGDDAEDPLNLRASGGVYSASASYSHSPNYPSSAFSSPPATDRKVSRKRDRTGNAKVEPTTGLTYAQARGSGYLENAPQYSRRMQEYEGEIDDDEEELRLQGDYRISFSYKTPPICLRALQTLRCRSTFVFHLPCPPFPPFLRCL